MITLYRDDDINKYTDLTLLRQIHSLFLKYNKIHTIAVEMEGLWEAKGMWYWVTDAKNLEVGLHGWTHKDYSTMSYVDIVNDLKKSLDYWYGHIAEGSYMKKEITTFFPPWNRVSENLKEACKTVGLQLDARVGGDVYNFHWWTCTNDYYVFDLEEHLKA